MAEWVRSINVFDSIDVGVVRSNTTPIPGNTLIALLYQENLKLNFLYLSKGHFFLSHFSIEHFRHYLSRYSGTFIN